MHTVTGIKQTQVKRYAHHNNENEQSIQKHN